MPEAPNTPGVFIEETSMGPPTIAGVETSITAFVGGAATGPTDDPTSVGNWQEYEATFGPLAPDSLMGFAIRDYFRNGGRQARVVRVAGPVTAASITAGGALRPGRAGLYALEGVETFNLLSIPPYLESGDVDPSVVADAAAYCEERRAILLVDPPSAWADAGDVVGTHSATGLAALGTESANAALYFPRVIQPDPLRNDAPGTFVPSGAVAGVIARTDRRRGVWKAPAGLEAKLSAGTEPAVLLTDRENGELNPRGVNCLRTFPTRGTVVWGARTLQGDDRLGSEWKYLPVRRLALHIEESLDRGLRWAVFEPNDDRLWAGLRTSTATFLDGLFRRGAFQGARHREAFFVKCDRETTTQSDIDDGFVNVLVGFAPLRPAEFVILEIRLEAGRS